MNVASIFPSHMVSTICFQEAGTSTKALLPSATALKVPVVTWRWGTPYFRIFCVRRNTPRTGRQGDLVGREHPSCRRLGFNPDQLSALSRTHLQSDAHPQELPARWDRRLLRPAPDQATSPARSTARTRRQAPGTAGESSNTQSVSLAPELLSQRSEAQQEGLRSSRISRPVSAFYSAAL